MKRFTIMAAGLLAAAAEAAVLVPYGQGFAVEVTFLDADGFPLEGVADGDGTGESDLATIRCDGGSAVALTNSFVEQGDGGYLFVFEDAELECKRVRVKVNASDVQSFAFVTYGHEDAQYPEFGLLSGDAYAAIGNLPSAVEIRQEIDTNSEQLQAIVAAVGALPDASEIADAVANYAVETGVTVECALAVMFSVLVGEYVKVGDVTTTYAPDDVTVRVVGSTYGLGERRYDVTFTCP